MIGEAKVKVSVVMTTYNGEKYLCQMLDSLRMQERKIDELLFLMISRQMELFV